MSGRTCSSRRAPGGDLMDQCSVARHPISATGDLTNQPGHDLTLGIDNHSRFKQCSPAGGSVTSFPHLAFTGDGITDPHPLGSPVMRSAGELVVDRRLHASEIARFHRHVVCGPSVSDCGIWTGAIGADGYGRIPHPSGVGAVRAAASLRIGGRVRRRRRWCARSARMRQPGVRESR